MQKKVVLYGVLWLWLFLGASPTWARLPEEADYTVLANYINTNNDLATLRNERKWPEIAAYLNAYPPSPAGDYWLLRESVSLRQVYEDYSPDNTLWDWSVFFGLPIDNLEKWRELWVVTGQIDPRKPNIVQAITAIMPGAPYATLRTFLLSIRRRLATRAEALFTTGTGTGTTANPSITRLTVAISGNDVAHALTGAPLL